MNDAAVTVNDLLLRAGRRVLIENLSFTAHIGEAIGIIGPSGSGKTSLLRCLAALAVPDVGTISIGPTTISALSAPQRTAFRLNHIGMVFQFGGLLPELSVVSNVALPLQLAGSDRRSAEEQALGMLASLGIDHLAHVVPDTLSGGETQRVGIARALVSGPSVIIADEPTGALDERNSVRITDMLIERSRITPATLISATHDPLVFERMDRVIDLRKYQPVVGEDIEAAAIER